MRKRAVSLGFSLVELIAVIVILAALAIAVSPRFMSGESAAIHTTRVNIIMAFAQAQQIAMAQGEAVVVLDSNRVDVQSEGKSINWPGVSDPDSKGFPALVRVTSGTGSWEFDKLGRTREGSITINDQASITVEASGYAY